MISEFLDDWAQLWLQYAVLVQYIAKTGIFVVSYYAYPDYICLYFFIVWDSGMLVRGDFSYLNGII